MCDVCLTLLHMCESSLSSQQITESRKWTYTARTLYPDLTYNHMLRAGYLLRNYYLKYVSGDTVCVHMLMYVCVRVY